MASAWELPQPKPSSEEESSDDSTDKARGGDVEDTTDDDEVKKRGSSVMSQLGKKSQKRKRARGLYSIMPNVKQLHSKRLLRLHRVEERRVKLPTNEQENPNQVEEIPDALKEFSRDVVTERVQTIPQPRPDDFTTYSAELWENGQDKATGGGSGEPATSGVAGGPATSGEAGGPATSGEENKPAIGETETADETLPKMNSPTSNHSGSSSSGDDSESQENKLEICTPQHSNDGMPDGTEGDAKK